MLAPAPTPDEVDRLRALHGLAILDTPPEERFDRLTRLARNMLGAPIAVVSLVDAERQWFKSIQGLDACETGRDVSFCGHAILGDGIFEVPDPLLDPRFADNPLVTGPPHVRFYAGVVLHSADGYHLGTLCVIGHEPRRLTDAERAILLDLAACAEDELRRLDVQHFSAEIQRAQSRLNEAQHIAKVGSWELDMGSGKLFWTDEIFNLFEIDKHQFEASYDAFLQAIHPDDRETVNSAYARSLRTREPYVVTHRLLMPDGRIKWVEERCNTDFDADGMPVVSRGTVQDVTERKLADQDLQESEQRFRSMVENAGDAIYIHDRFGSIRDVNRVASEQTGYGYDELVGMSVRQLDAHTDFSTLRETWDLGKLDPGLFPMTLETAHRRKDGTVFPIEVRISLLPDDEEALFVAMVRDITERKRVERMKDEFVSTVSHELRTPLTSISGALGLLAGGVVGEFTPEASQMIELARKNADRLRLLINDLLDMEKIVSGKMQFDLQPLVLRYLVEQAVTAARPMGASRSVQIDIVAYGGDDLVVQVDAPRLMQVLANLLSNAVKFSPDGGRVEVAVERFQDTARVTVTDHGRGIPQTFRDRIFQKFSQADASDSRDKGGTGLGLAISKELVEHMQGRIGFDSVEGQGASFYIEFPCGRMQT